MITAQIENSLNSLNSSLSLSLSRCSGRGGGGGERREGGRQTVRRRAVERLYENTEASGLRA